MRLLFRRLTLREVLRAVVDYRLRILEAVCLIGVTLLVLTIAVLFIYERTASTGAYRPEVSGRVVDKMMRFYESDEGSSVERLLIIDEENGSRSAIVVGEKVYEKAMVGMRFKKGRSGVELHPDETTRAPE
jgi:hypothetical protein